MKIKQITHFTLNLYNPKTNKQKQSYFNVYWINTTSVYFEGVSRTCYKIDMLKGIIYRNESDNKYRKWVLFDNDVIARYVFKAIVKEMKYSKIERYIDKEYEFNENLL